MRRPPEKRSLEDWAAALPELKRRGRELVGPCPACGGDDRFHVAAAPDGYALVGCRGCIDGKPPGERAAAFVRILKATFPVDDFDERPSPNRPARLRRPPPAARPTDPGPDLAWNAGGGIGGTPAEAWLVARRAWPPRNSECWKPWPDAVRWLPRSRWPRGTGHPPREAAGCILWRYSGPRGETRAVQYEALTRDGASLERRWRRCAGEKKDAWFRVSARSLASEGEYDARGERRFVVFAEGECDALALCWLLPGCETVGCGGTAGARSFSLFPDDGRTAVLSPDPDKAGNVVDLDVTTPTLAFGTAFGTDETDVPSGRPDPCVSLDPADVLARRIHRSMVFDFADSRHPTLAEAWDRVVRNARFDSPLSRYAGPRTRRGPEENRS